MTHATVTRDGYNVPLIGIPQDATLEQCDCCHDVFPMRLVTWTGSQWLCGTCAEMCAKVADHS